MVYTVDPKLRAILSDNYPLHSHKFTDTPLSGHRLSIETPGESWVDKFYYKCDIQYYMVKCRLYTSPIQYVRTYICLILCIH